MQRRKSLDKFAVAGGWGCRSAGGVGRAVAHGNRLAQGLGSHLGGVELLCKRVGELVGGEFEIRWLTPEEVIRPAQPSMR